MPQPGGMDRRRFLKYSGFVGAGTLVSGWLGGDEEIGDTRGEVGALQDGQNVNSYATIVAPSSIDPMKSTDELEGIISHTVYDPLLYYSYSYPPEPIPWIAEDWERSADGKKYTFRLRDDVTFHNGDKLTAQDVAFSVERMMTMQQGPSWMWDGVLTPDSATAVDETTVELQLEQVYAPFIATLPWMFIVNEKQVVANEKDGDLGTAWLENNDAGSGAYTLENYQRGTELTYGINDDWWGEFVDGNVYEEVRMALAQEVSTIVGKMRTGEATMTDGWLTIDTYEQLESQGNIVVSDDVTFIKPFYVFMNTQTEPLNDVNVRKALAYAFDYDTAVSEVLVGGEKLTSPLPSDFKYSTTDGVEQYSRNMDRARSHLGQSDYAPEEVNVTYTYVAGLTAEQNLGLLMQTNYQELGINFNIQVAPWTTIVSRSTNQDTAPQMFPLWNNTTYADADSILYGMWHSSNIKSYLNGSKYQNEKVDSLLEEGRSTLNEKKRADVYKQVQQIVSKDAAAIFVCLDAARWANAKNLQGFVNNGINGYTHQFHKYREV